MIMYVVDKSDWKKALKTGTVLALIAVYLFIFSGSRTGVMITFLCLAAMILASFKKQIGLFDKIRWRNFRWNLGRFCGCCAGASGFVPKET